jgi:hypothetical protein
VAFTNHAMLEEKEIGVGRCRRLDLTYSEPLGTEYSKIHKLLAAAELCCVTYTNRDGN